MMIKLIKSMFHTITRPIQNLIMSYLRYLAGSPSLTDHHPDTKRDGSPTLTDHHPDTKRDGSPSLTDHHPDTKRDHYATLIIEHSNEFGRENVLYAATHAYVFNKLGIHSDNLHVELTLADWYQGIELNWRIFVNKSIGNIHRESFELRFDKRHKDLVYNSYIPYVESRAKEIMMEIITIREVHTYSHSLDTWETKSLENHSTFKTIAMKEELKRGLIHDLDRFIKNKDFYDRVGRPWTRNYLLYGPPGTGKTSLVAAMAKYLNFDVYDLQLSRAVKSDFNPRTLLLGVMDSSILLVEDIDEGSSVLALSNLLRCLVWSPWGRIVIFTTNNKDMLDPTLLSRMNMEIYMGHCCFEGFKALASKYLGLSHDNDEPHRLYPDIKRLIDGQVITPGQVTEELMKSEDVDVVLEGLVRTLENLTLEKIDGDEEKQFPNNF